MQLPRFSWILDVLDDKTLQETGKRNAAHENAKLRGRASLDVTRLIARRAYVNLQNYFRVRSLVDVRFGEGTGMGSPTDQNESIWVQIVEFKNVVVHRKKTC